jgi:hypothetical protein
MKNRRTFDHWGIISNGLKVYIEGSYKPEDPFDDLEYDVDFQCPECDVFLGLEYDDLSEDVKNELHIIVERALDQKLIADRYAEYN